MTISRFFPPIKIHPILTIFIVISFLTGTFLQLMIILLIVLIHEFGHYAMAYFLKWKISGITLWVFGGVMHTDEQISRPFYEETLVTLAGPFQHLVIYGILYLYSLAGLQLIPSVFLEVILFYNTMILVFNLLPIWPLDGGKLIFLALSKVYPFRKAFETILVLSIVVCLWGLGLQIAFFSFNLSAFLMSVFLLKENSLDWHKRHYYFIRHLFQRYQGKTFIQKNHPLAVPYTASLKDVFAQFYRGRKHTIYIIYPEQRRVQIDENDCLRSYFHEKRIQVTMDDLSEK